MRLRINAQTVFRSYRVPFTGVPSPFGFDEESLDEVLPRVRDAGVQLEGVHLHAGAQCTSVEGVLAVARGLRPAGTCRGTSLNLGGGFGAIAPTGTSSTSQRSRRAAGAEAEVRSEDEDDDDDPLSRPCGRVREGSHAVQRSMRERTMGHTTRGSQQSPQSRSSSSRAAGSSAPLASTSRASSPRSARAGAPLPHPRWRRAPLLLREHGADTADAPRAPVLNLSRPDAPLVRRELHECSARHSTHWATTSSSPSRASDLLAFQCAGAYGPSFSPTAFLSHASPLELLVNWRRTARGSPHRWSSDPRGRWER